MGVVDTDGFLTITDRVKDVIIRGGEKHLGPPKSRKRSRRCPRSPRSRWLRRPTTAWASTACAIVRLAAPDAILDLGDITAALEQIGLARPKWPEELRIVGDFPRTPSGKIRKVDLRRQLRTSASDGTFGGHNG